MRESRSFLVIIGATLLVTASVSGTALAQAGGCPWCTSPTVCELIDEDTFVIECEVASSGPHAGECVNTQAGDCEWQVLLAPPLREAFLASQGIEYGGEATIDVHGITIAGILIEDGLLAKWGCNGKPAFLFRNDGSGVWREVDLANSPNRYSFEVRAPSHNGPPK